MKRSVVIFGLRGLSLLGIVCFFFSFISFSTGWSADKEVEFGVVDDLTVQGQEGGLNDADVEVEGNSVFQRQVNIHTEGLSTSFAGFGKIENLLIYSEALDNTSGWIATTMLVSADAVNGPDETLTAETLTNNGASSGYIEQSASISSSTTYVFSVWLKAGTSTSAQLEISDNGSTPSSNTVDITLTDKWKRYEVSFTSASDATQATVKIINSGADLTCIYAWGAQLEEKEHAGQYVKTEGQVISSYIGAVVNSDLRIGSGSFDNPTSQSDLYVTGNLEVDGSTWLGDEATVDTLTVTGNFVLQGTQTIDGSLKVGDGTPAIVDMSSLSGQQDLFVTDDAEIGDALYVNGNAVLGDGAGDTVTFNAGSVLAPNNLSIDGGTLYVDSTNDRVGIGTTAPSQALDVNGNMVVDSTDGVLFVDTVNNRVGINNTAPAADLDVLSTLRLRVDAANYFTFTPSDEGNRLIVEGEGYGTLAAIKVQKLSNWIEIGTGATSGATSWINTFQDGGSYLPLKIMGKRLYFNTGDWGSNQERMRIDAVGNVGIGTSSPSARLDVFGENNVQSNNDPASTALSSTFNLFSALQAVDDDTTTKAWDTTGNVAGDALQVDLGAGTTKDYVALELYLSASGYDGTYDVQYSDDGSTWTTVYSGFAPSLKGWNRVEWANAGAHQYWRLILSSASSAVNGDIMEMKWFEATDASVLYVDKVGRVGVQTTPSRASLEVKSLGVDSAQVSDVDTTTAIVDEVKVDDFETVTWRVVVSKGSARRVSTVTAVHDGTGLADATTVNYSEYGVVSVGSFTATPVVEVDLAGTGTSQVMRLKVTVSDDDVSVKAYRLGM